MLQDEPHHDEVKAPLRQTRLLVERLVEIVRRNPDAVHQRSLLGSLLVQLGKADEGIAQVERAVALSNEKYCSASAMLAHTAAITWTLAVLEDEPSAA